jgi:hypothetical protein
MMPVNEYDIQPYISRCAVCEAPANVFNKKFFNNYNFKKR